MRDRHNVFNLNVLLNNLLTDLLYGRTTSNPSTVVMTSGVAITSSVPISTTKNIVSSTMLPTTQLSTEPSTTTSTTPTTTSTTTPSTMSVPYWLSWGEWKCEIQLSACFQRRFRNCSTGTDKDCIDVIGGVRYSIDICTSTSCPGINNLRIQNIY